MRKKALLKHVALVQSKPGVQILRHFFALRENFTGRSCLGLGFDSSRVGARSRMLGYVTKPTGHGGWLPPQDTRCTSYCGLD